MTPEKLSDESQDTNSSVPEQTESPRVPQPAGVDDELWRHNMSLIDPEHTLDQNSTQTSSKLQDSIPWGEVALAALLTPILALILYQLIAGVILSLGFIVAFVLIVLMPVIYALPVVAALAISGKFLVPLHI